MVHVNSCCCGCSLKTGSLITSIWELFMAVLALAVGIWVVVSTDSEDVDSDTFNPEDTLMSHLRIWGIVVICEVVILGFFAVLLLIGTVKKVPSLVKAWIVFAIIWVIFIIVGIFISITNGRPNDGLSIIFVLLKIYCIIVVHSFHHDLTSPPSGTDQPAVPVCVGSAQPPAYTSVVYMPAKGEVV